MPPCQRHPVQDERLGPSSLEEVLQEAADGGVQQLACNGCWQEDWGRVAALAALHPTAIVPNFGLHPWWLGQRSPDWLQQLRSMLEEHPSAGLGEVCMRSAPAAGAGQVLSRCAACRWFQLSWN